MERLRQALQARGVPARVVPSPAEAAPGERLIVVAGASAPMGRASGVRFPSTPEALGLASGRLGEKPAVFAIGSDVRGVVYAVMELADQAAAGVDPSVPALAKPVVQQPVNRIRSVLRIFSSDVEDRPWYNDRVFWRGYLGMLVSQGLLSPIRRLTRHAEFE